MFFKTVLLKLSFLNVFHFPSLSICMNIFLNDRYPQTMFILEAHIGMHIVLFWGLFAMNNTFNCHFGIILVKCTKTSLNPQNSSLIDFAP